MIRASSQPSRAEGVQQQHQAHQQPEADGREHRIDQGGGGAGADAGELQVDGDVLRRLDPQLLLQGYPGAGRLSRGSVHLNILPPPRTRSESRWRTFGP